MCRPGSWICSSRPNRVSTKRPFCRTPLRSSCLYTKFSLCFDSGGIFSIHDETHHHHPHHAHPEPVGKIGVRTVTQWSFGLGLEFDCSTQCTQHTECREGAGTKGADTNSNTNLWWAVLQVLTSGEMYQLFQLRVVLLFSNAVCDMLRLSALWKSGF